MENLRRTEFLHINKLLREAGLKSTPQRSFIYSYLIKSYAHPTAETIFNDVKKEYPSVSLNTIYQTLEIFEKKRIIFDFSLLNFYKFNNFTIYYIYYIIK